MQKNNPKESIELFWLGQLFYMNEMFEESIPYFKKAIHINPKDEDAH